LAAGLAGAFAGAAATAFLLSVLTGAAAAGFLASAFGAAAFSFAVGFAATGAGFAATAAVFLTSGLAATFPALASGAALDVLDEVTGTEELTFGMDFWGTALDTAGGVALALTGMGFLSGAALFAFAGTFGLETLEVLLLTFAGVLLLTFLLIVALFFAVDLTATAFLGGATGFFTATTFFGPAFALLFTLAFDLLNAACALVATTDFFTGAPIALLLAALFAAGLSAVLAMGLATALAGLAITFLATTGLALDAGAFFTGMAFFATGFFTAGLDAFVFFGVGMVQPSVMKRIGWRHQQSHALADKRRPIKDNTGTWGQAVRANIWIAALAVGWPG
jgi:hypothetical protein